MRKKRYRPSLLTALVLLLAAPCAADQVVLVNGEVLEGEIVEQTDSFVTLQTMTNTLRLPAMRIKEVRPSPPGTMELLRARDALSRRQLAEAKKFLAEAENKGAAPESVAELQDLIERNQRELELARYSKLIDTARQAAAKGEASESLDEIRKVLDSLPADSPSRQELIDILVDYHLARAEDHRDKVRVQMAVDELRKAIDLDPQCAEAYLDLADVFKTSVASHSQAITCYARAIECGKEVLPPRDLTRAYWELGEIYRQQKKWKEASLSFREVYQREPEFNLHLRDRVLEAYKAFANEIERAHPAAALTVAEEGLKVRYDSELALKQGKLLNQLEEYERSNEVLSELLQGDPRTKMAHYYRALNFLGSSELLQCREALQREIAINPDNFDALILLGDLALQRDDYEPAQTFYGRAQAVQPDNPLASLGLCKAHRMKGELEKAKDAAKEVLARFPEDREANLEMGRILVAEEDYEDARTFFTNVLDLIEKAPPEEKATLDRLQADALLARGEIALLTAGPGTANKDFRRALEVLPDYGQAYYSIGIAYRKKFASTKQVSDLKTAEENIQKSRELTPENPQFALQLGILYSQELAQADPANRKVYLDKAVKNWESYIELGGANTSQVRRWIDEIKGGGNATTEQAKADS